MPILTLARLLWVCFLLLVHCPARAGGFEPITTWCVTNSTELQAALTAAESNASGDVIRVATGYYPVPIGGFDYDAWAAGDDGFSLTLIGGWSEFLANPCGQQLAQDPFNTVLDGGGIRKILRLRVQPTSRVTIQLLAFYNGFDEVSGGGLEIASRPQAFYSASAIHIERNAFLGNEAQNGGGLYIRASVTGNARLGLLNNLFVGNRAQARWGAAYLLWDGGNSGSLGAGIRMVSNTIINNTSDLPTATPGGIRITGSTPNKYVINNIIWGNDNVDLVVDSSGDVFQLHNNNIGVRTGTEPTSQSANLSVELIREPCSDFKCFNWIVPSSDSPLIDSGRHPSFISPFWVLTSLDLRGKPRIHYGTVDIGAYESHDRIFSDRFQSN